MNIIDYWLKFIVNMLQPTKLAKNSLYALQVVIFDVKGKERPNQSDKIKDGDLQVLLDEDNYWWSILTTIDKIKTSIKEKYDHNRPKDTIKWFLNTTMLGFMLQNLYKIIWKTLKKTSYLTLRIHRILLLRTTAYFD